MAILDEIWYNNQNAIDKKVWQIKAYLHEKMAYKNGTNDLKSAKS
jgi:hypothetical protein